MHNHQMTQARRSPLKTALPHRGPPVIPTGGRLWVPIQASQNVRSRFEADFEEGSDYSSTRISLARGGWSSLSAINTILEFKQVLDALSDASGRLRFEHCLDSYGKLLYIRATQGHSGTLRIDPQFFTLLEIPKRWKTYFFAYSFS